MSDTSGAPVTPYTPTSVPANANSFAQTIADIGSRLMAGAAARGLLGDRITVLEGKPIVPDLSSRVSALEAKPTIPDLTPRVTALEARPIVPDLTTRVTTLESRPNYTTATLATAGVIKANVTQIARTTTPVSVSVPAISVLGLTALAATSTATVPGVQLGDSVQATFAAAPPTGLVPTGAVVTAANTVLVTFAATQALTLAAGTQNLNFCWTR